MSNEYDDAIDSILSKGWLSIQTDIVRKFALGISGQNISEAASHFMVARQFPKRGASRADDFDCVVPLLISANKKVTRQTIDTVTVELADSLKATTGLTRGRPISAASKFLWCASPDIGIIYDQHARRQLVRIGYRVPHRDYSAYVSAFKTEARKRSDDLQMALARRNLEGESWLAEKLFDHWLYLQGRPN